MILMRFGLSPAQWLSTVLIVGLLLLVGLQDPERLALSAQPPPIAVPLLPISGLRREGTERIPLADLSATSVYAISQENGEVLFEHNKNTDYAPASTTKLMTALVARRTYPLDQILVVPPIGFADAKQPLQVGQTYTVAQLLSALLINSNNTAAYTLAAGHPQGLEGFVADMNALSATLGLTNTYFTNPAGFDDPNHRSTARDLGLLFRAALLDPIVAAILGTKQAPLVNSDGVTVSTLSNTHQLIGSDSRVLAGKTGTTDEAKQVLITSLTTGVHPYVLVILGSSDRYGETRRLADWVDQRYTWQIMTPASLLESIEYASDD